MTKYTLKAQKRTLLGRKVKTLRSQGILPASLFGKDVKTQNLSLDQKEFFKIYSQVGESGLVYLQVDSSQKDLPIIFSEVTVHPITDTILHVSLRQVSLTEKIKAPVKIEISGKSPAVADGLGVLVQQVDEIEVEALPQDFPENITVNIDELTEVNSSISVKDLKLSTKLEIITDPDTILVKVDALTKEELPVPVVTSDAAAPEAEAASDKTEPTGEHKAE